MSDLEKLQALLQNETGHDELQVLPGHFLEDITSHVRELKNSAESAPNYREEELLRDQLKNVVQVYEGLMDRRKGKIFDLAVVVHQSNDTRAMLPLEARLFNALWDEAARHKDDVMAPIDAAYKRP